MAVKNKVILQLDMDTSGAKKGAKEVQSSMGKVEKSAKGMTSSLKGLGAAAAAAFSVGAIAHAAKELSTLALSLENVNKKASIVFGQYKKQVDKFAKDNAAALGLTESEVVKVAGSIGDLLIPMGFARDEAAKMSTDLISLSGALSEWSGGQVTATEVGEILAKAMLGEREQLKTLGIAISEADVQQRLMEKGQKKLTGTMLQQAKAVATQELIFEKSTDAQAAFLTNQDSLARVSGQASAAFKAISETLASALAPAFAKIAKGAVDVARNIMLILESFGLLEEENKGIVKSNMEVVKSTTEEIKTGQQLLDRYDELKTQTNLTAAEKTELKRITGDMVEIFGESVVQINKETGALELNRSEVLKQISARAALRSEAAQSILAEQAAIESRRAAIADQAAIIEESRRVAAEFASTVTDNILAEEQLNDIINSIAGSSSNLKGALDLVKNSFSDTAAAQESLDEFLAVLPQRFFKLDEALGRSNADLLRMASISEELGDLGIDLNSVIETTGTQSATSSKKVDFLVGSVAQLQAEADKLEKQLRGFTNPGTEEAIKLAEEWREATERVERAQRILAAEFRKNFTSFVSPTIEDTAEKFDEIYEEIAADFSDLQNHIIKETEASGLKQVEATKETEAEKKQIRDVALQGAVDIANQIGAVLDVQNANQIKSLEAQKERRLEIAGEDARARERIEAEYDKKIEDVQKKQFERNKRLQIANAFISLAQSIISILASSPDPLKPLGPLYIAQIAAATGITAAQIAAIGSQQFAEGGIDIDGPGTGTSDSIPARLSRGESVITAKRTRQYRPLLEAIHSGTLPIEFNNMAAWTDAGIIGAQEKSRRDITRLLKENNALLKGRTNYGRYFA